MILELRDLSSGYLPGVDVIRNINLKLELGSVTGILGNNGAGKTTLCQAIMNMNPYRSGQIIFDGEDVTHLSTEELSQRGISFHSSQDNTFPELSVWENLQIAARKGKEEKIDEIRQIFPILNIDKATLRHKTADKLSGGERNQLAIAICLLSDAKLLILDEPTAGLSPSAVKAMYQILNTIKQEKNITIYLVEQSQELLHRICKQLDILENGLFNK